tara:strand:- start:24 stop:2201 length:2178 start_codon:yes stop_codon:yes gene_type:complete
MRIFLLAAIIFIVTSNNAEANCDVTYSSDTAFNTIVCADDQTMTVNEGVTLSQSSGQSNWINIIGEENFTLVNNGTIDPGQTNAWQAISLQDATSFDITNNGTINGPGQMIEFIGNKGTSTITNTGTISTTSHAPITNYGLGFTGSLTINNSGTISAYGVNSGNQETHNPTHQGAISLGQCSSTSRHPSCSEEEDAGSAGGYTIINSGTIEVTDKGANAIRLNNKVNNTITNTGSILGGPEQAYNIPGSSGSSFRIGMDIMVVECHETSDANNPFGTCGASGSGTTTVNIGKGAKFKNGIDFNSTTGEIVIGSDINRDHEIRIFDYSDGAGGSDTITITNNSDHEVTFKRQQTLTFSDGSTNSWGSITPGREAKTSGNYTYQHSGQGDEGLTINAEFFNAGDDGILIIKGERLEVNQNNRKYQAENTLSKFRNFYNAADNIGHHAQRCSTLDENREDEDQKDCHEGFVKLFNSFQERDSVYEGRHYGGIGMNSPIFLNDNIVSNTFVGISTQDSKFDDGTSSWNNNLTFGLKNSYQNSGFQASLTPLIGLSFQKNSDFDTDKSETRKKSTTSQFAGVNAKISNDFGSNKKSFFTLGLQSSFSAERRPEYTSHFTDGALVVKENIDQLLSNTLEASYTSILSEKNFLGKIYAGGSTFKNYNNKVKVNARGFNSDVSNHGNQVWSGYHAGVSFVKENPIFNFEFDARYENQEGLEDKAVALTLNRKF